ncbi:hypothetical protein [Prevotella communis]|uniref:hypothetical protein n=1 Tax=Prevotella communis TaxID=2913614 RepID=UPI001ED9CFDF|nr:hypothetical protein [Prevotella communis]UKK55858.1 hypothetical protein L6476_10350 [Prevotella communis]
MHQIGELTDEKRLALIDEYLSSGKSQYRFEKEKAFLIGVFQDGFVPLQSKESLCCHHRRL